MKKNKICLLICFVISSSIFVNAVDARISCYRSNSYVFFDGFDFEKYSAETEGCEPMLEAAYSDICKEMKDPITDKYVDFVLVGHSQGGLRALAFAKYAKDRNSKLYSHIKGVITLSGIDQGLKLLANNGANFRYRFFADVGILTRGVLGCVAVIPGGDLFSNSLQYFIPIYDLGTSAIGYGIATAVLESIPETKNICTPVLSGNWDEYEQIKDMCPQSDFIKKYVIDKTFHYEKKESGSHTAYRVRWATKKVGWVRIKYPYIQKYTVTEYKNYEITTNNVKLDKNMNMAFLVGANNDTMSMVDDDSLRDGIDDGMEAASIVFTTGEVAHIARCACLGGLVTGSVKYAYDCGKAAKWTRDYKGELNDLKGSDANDGLVACSDQSLPTKTDIDGVSEKTILTNTETHKYSSLNHATIADSATVKNTYKALIADWTTQ